MKFLLPLLVLFCAVSAFAQSEPGKLPEVPYDFSYEYSAENISDTGTHLGSGIFVIFSADTRTANDMKNYHYAFKISPLTAQENGLADSLLLSRQIDEAKKMFVRSPGADSPSDKRTIKIKDKTYLVLGSVAFFK